MFFCRTTSTLPALAFAALLMVSALPLRGALAQDAPPVAENPNEIKSLAAALPLLGWDSKAHGVLLAIAPEAVTWRPPDAKASPVADEAVAKPLLAPRRGYPLNASFVARHFSRKLITLPTMTVLAPTTMRRLVLPPQPESPYEDLSGDDALLLLEATLSPAQWTKIGSSDGLGMGDLTAQQQPLFLALMPEETRVYRPESDSFDVHPGSKTEIPPTALTDNQRQNLCVRLMRSCTMCLVSKDGRAITVNAFHDERSQEASLQLTISADPKSDDPGSGSGVVRVREKVPNRLKPSDLDLKAPGLNVWVPVDGVKTVGDLIQAVKAKTDLELYADGELARLSVALIGEGSLRFSARDILEALCWALSATYRKVGPTAEHPGDVAYVLTYDREGLAALEGRMSWWGWRGNSEQEVLIGRAILPIFQQNPKQYLSFSSGSLMAPTPEALSAFENTSTVPISLLTPIQREQMKAALAELAADPNPPKYAIPQTDCVSLSLGYQVEFRIPGLGIVQEDTEFRKYHNRLIDSEQAQFAYSNPLPGKNVILAVAAPRDAAEANTLMAAAAKHGVRQVWIQATESNVTAVADCVAAGRAQHVPVGALVSLMTVASGAVSRQLQTINVFGETGSEFAAAFLKEGPITDMENDHATPMMSPDDYLDPARPETLTQIERRVAPLAAISGLAGLALREAAVPGYGWRVEPDFYAFAGISFGYTLENRLAFLRAHGFDPIDGSLRRWDVVPIPFFGGDGSGNIPDDSGKGSLDMRATFAAWHTLLIQQQIRLLKHLHADLSASAPQLPIYLSPDGMDYTPEVIEENDAYQLWDDPNDVPKIRMTDDEVVSSPALRQRRAPIVFYRHAQFAKAGDKDPAFAQKITEAGMIAARLHNLLIPEPDSPNPLPSTVVLDLTSMPVAEALPLIGGVFLPAP